MIILERILEFQAVMFRTGFNMRHVRPFFETVQNCRHDLCFGINPKGKDRIFLWRLHYKKAAAVC